MDRRKAQGKEQEDHVGQEPQYQYGPRDLQDLQELRVDKW